MADDLYRCRCHRVGAAAGPRPVRCQGSVKFSWLHVADEPWLRALLNFQIGAAIAVIGGVLVAAYFGYSGARIVRWARSAPGVGRGTTIVVVLILATTYALRGHIIIFSKGVPGWGYGPPTMASTVPPDLRSVSAETANLLQQGLRPEIAHHLKTAGYLKGEVFLLHFDDGTIKPGNFGLTRTPGRPAPSPSPTATSSTSRNSSSCCGTLSRSGGAATRMACPSSSVIPTTSITSRSTIGAIRRRPPCAPPRCGGSTSTSSPRRLW